MKDKRIKNQSDIRNFIQDNINSEEIKKKWI